MAVLTRKPLNAELARFFLWKPKLKRLKTASNQKKPSITPYSLLAQSTGMDNIGASYKYLRKSPCEAKASFFG